MRILRIYETHAVYYYIYYILLQLTSLQCAPHAAEIARRQNIDWNKLSLVKWFAPLNNNIPRARNRKRRVYNIISLSSIYAWESPGRRSSSLCIIFDFPRSVQQQQQVQCVARGVVRFRASFSRRVTRSPRETPAQLSACYIPSCLIYSRGTHPTFRCCTHVLTCNPRFSGKS